MIDPDGRETKEFQTLKNCGSKILENWIWKNKHYYDNKFS